MNAEKLFLFWKVLSQAAIRHFGELLADWVHTEFLYIPSQGTDLLDL